MDRSCEIYHVLSTAATVDDEAAELLADIRRQAHTGRSRIVAALRGMDALDPALGNGEAEDIVYTCLSFEVARILTVERGWSAEQYQAWITRRCAPCYDRTDTGVVRHGPSDKQRRRDAPDRPPTVQRPDHRGARPTRCSRSTTVASSTSDTDAWSRQAST